MHVGREHDSRLTSHHLISWGCKDMRTPTHHRVLLACILGTVASTSAQGIINSSDYIPAPHSRVKKASTPVSTPKLQTVGGGAAAPPEDGAVTVEQVYQSDGPGVEQPEMRFRIGKARAPAAAEHEDGRLPQQRWDDTTLKQRAQNDSIPHQKSQENRIPKQRQLDITLPTQRTPEGPLPRKQAGGKGQEAPAPSDTRASDQSDASSAASMLPQLLRPTPDSQGNLIKEAPSAGLIAYPAAYTAAGPSPGSDMSEPALSQASPPVGDEQKADISNYVPPSQKQQGITGLQTGAPEAALPLQSIGTDVPGSHFADPVHVSKPAHLTAGQEALRDLLGEAGAAPAQHSIAGYQKAPASRYAVQQGMLQGYFDVWPAPAPCGGYYSVRALSEEHSSRDVPIEAPRYSTQLAVSGVTAALPPKGGSNTGNAPPAESGYVQASSPQSLAEIPIAAVSPSVGGQDIQDPKDKQGWATAAASAPTTEADGALQPQETTLSRTDAAPDVILPPAAHDQAASAQAPQHMADMYGQSESIQSLQPEWAKYGAYAPGPGTEPSNVDMNMLSAAYKAGYQAGYEAARKALTGLVGLAHTSPVAASPPPSNQSFEIPEAVSKPLAQASHPDAQSSYSQHTRFQPQAYGHYGGTPQGGKYGSKSPTPTGEAGQGTRYAAAYSPEAVYAQSRHSYGSQAPAYAYYSYAYQGSYSLGKIQTLLQATAHEQAAHFQTVQLATSARASAEAPGPGSAIATQSFAEAPVVRSYPGEQQPASAAQAEAPAPSYTYNMLSAHARNLSLAPALSTALAPASELAYGRLPTYEAASPSAGTYKQQRPHAYALEPVLPPGLEPADTAMQPSQAPSMQNGPDNGHSARAAYAPGPQPSTPPVEAPVGGRLMAQAPAPAPSTAAGLTSGSVLPYAPAAPPAAYAPVQAVSPSGYGAYGYPASLQGGMQPGLAPSAGPSGLPALMPSAAPLPAPCEVCHRPEGGASPEGAAPEVVLSILDGSELAQYVDQEGSDANVVYFVARAAFSRPPTNFTAQDVTVMNGTAVEVIPESTCGHFLVKGYVQEQQAAGGNSTAVALSINAGTLQDCAGNLFPAASAAGNVSDRPTGWLQAPDLGMNMNASALGEPQVFLTLTFSQPVLSVSPADIRVNLTQSSAQDGKNSSSTEGRTSVRRSLAEDVSGCVPEARVQSSSPEGASNGTSRAYSFIVGLSSCFKGKVAIEYLGSAQTLRGVTSFPVKPFYFWHPDPGP